MRDTPNDGLELTAIERARQFIDDILRINAEHGMRSVTSDGAYERAVAAAYKKTFEVAYKKTNRE